MWLLENAGSAFQGRRLWLRPGKRYLFGRTRAERMFPMIASSQSENLF